MDKNFCFPYDPQWKLARISSWISGKFRAPTSLRYIAGAPLYAYKVVEVGANGRLFSLYAPDKEYVLGRRETDRARPGYRGGLYAGESAANLEAALNRGHLLPPACVIGEKTLALIAVELSGRVLRYDGNDLAATYLRPCEVITVLNYGEAPSSVRK